MLTCSLRYSQSELPTVELGVHCGGVCVCVCGLRDASFFFNYITINCDCQNICLLNILLLGLVTTCYNAVTVLYVFP